MRRRPRAAALCLFKKPEDYAGVQSVIEGLARGKRPRIISMISREICGQEPYCWLGLEIYGLDISKKPTQRRGRSPMDRWTLDTRRTALKESDMSVRVSAFHNISLT